MGQTLCGHALTIAATVVNIASDVPALARIDWSETPIFSFGAVCLQNVRTTTQSRD
ncbi:MAG: hypothetical protein J4N80_11120 [Chloroflexi bacterium]|nr:hypothetical protein [Chloroflexota bacterium]